MPIDVRVFQQSKHYAVKRVSLQHSVGNHIAPLARHSWHEEV